jgi:hypothetical protein
VADPILVPVAALPGVLVEGLPVVDTDGARGTCGLHCPDEGPDRDLLALRATAIAVGAR